MNREGTGEFNTDSSGHTHRYDKGGGSDIDTSDKTQKTCDGGHIPGRYQWEETVDVSADDGDNNDTEDD